MRNLKKVLALVLAMVMALSLMTVASAKTTFEDTGDAKYQEAVKVLGALDVFQGYSEDKSNFMPKQSITRAEVATILYRIDTGDVKGEKEAIYANNDFEDVVGHWAAGAIGYCVNKGILKGYDDGTIKPNNKITGYEVLAMILREVGYDQKNEFSSNWPMTVATTARHVGASTTLTKSDFDTLNSAAAREVVAELLFRTMVNAEMVYPNALWNYRTTNNLNPGAEVNGVKDITLGEFKFGLAKSERKTVDKWGRPGYDWLTDAKITWDSNANINGVNGKKEITDGDKLITIKEAPQAQYNKAVAECDVAHEVGLKDPETYDTLWINGQKYDPNNDQTDTSYTIVPTNVDTKIGAQGRVTEVYEDRIVMVDTFLARVTNVSAPEYDAKDHLKTKARLTLTVYDNASGTYPTNDQTGTQNLYWEQDGEFTYKSGAKIARGDMILINAFTSNVAKDGYADKADATSLGELTNNIGDWDIVSANTSKKIEYMEVVDKATVVANTRQTYIYWYTNQHEIGNKTYDDAMTFYHDQAGSSNAAWNWYLDQYNNVIGSDAVTTEYNYGVITRLWWVNDDMGNGKAHVSVKYMDGSTDEKLTLSRMTVNTAGVDTAYVAATGASAYSATSGGDDILFVDNANDKFYITTNWATNGENSDAVGSNSATYRPNYIDAIGGHLFRFQSDGEGVISATEVAGDSTNPDAYAGLYNATNVRINNNRPDVVGDDDWKLRMDDHTQYLVRTGTDYTDYQYGQVTGLSHIGNFEANATDEYDFVDVDNDGIAEYVYIIASTVDSTKELLFYYNGGRIVQNVNDGTWTVHGFVDGEAGTITIANIDSKDLIDDRIRDNYEKHINNDNLGDLYRVVITGGVVDRTALYDGMDRVALDASNAPIALDFSDGRTDPYGSSYSAVLLQGEDTTNSFGQGTFWTYKTADGSEFMQFRTTAAMKTPTGEFVSNMANKDVILVYSHANNQMAQAYIADVFGESSDAKTVYKLNTKNIAAAGNGGITVTADIQQRSNVNDPWADYGDDKDVTVKITYTYFSGTDRRTATMEEDVAASALRAGYTFYPGGLVVNTSVTVSATVSNSDIGTFTVENNKGIIVEA